MMKEYGLKFDKYEGTWYVIDSIVLNGKLYFLLESETWGDEEPCLIVDEDLQVVVDDVWNGFDDLKEVIS